MGKQTKIGWTQSTWNPWRGCHKVSAGCKNCYMFRDQKKWGNIPNLVVRSRTTFNDPLKWQEPSMIFTCSWSDFFIKEADPWRDEAWEIIMSTPQHTYQILTKRPERIRECLPVNKNGSTYIPRNIWWGVSIEDQSQLHRYDTMDAALYGLFPQVLFISAEPLLGSLDLDDVLREIDLGDEETTYWTHPPDWVIVGGESGRGYRDMPLDAFTSLVDQLIEFEVPTFVKQDSAVYPGKQGRIPDKYWQIKEYPECQNIG